ncbi:MAG: hypothetical protein U1E78_09615 [Gammaproteobacteria bacterium]
MIDYKKLTTAILSIPEEDEPAKGPAPTVLNLENNPTEFSNILRKQIEAIQDTKGKKYYTTDGSTLSAEPSNDKKIKESQKSIRIFTTPPEPSPLDLYQRGLQFGRAALTVIEHTPNATLQTEQFKKITDMYSKQMLAFKNAMAAETTEKDKLKYYKEAAKLTHLYLGAMCHLVDPNNPKKAHSDIKKASDMLVMMEPMEDIICTYIPKDTDKKTLQFSERLNPDAQAHISDEKKGWLKYNIEKHGNWFRLFVGNNWEQLSNKPTPSTARDLPHAANTWDEITVTTGPKLEDYRESHSGRIGITTPYQYKGKDNTEDRIQHAADASRSLLETQYENMIARYERKWSSLYEPNEEITLPILHATYVAPTFFYSADRIFITEKTSANQKFREEHLNQTFDPENAAGRKYRFKLLEVNNCINIHRHLAYNSPRDRNDSNELICFSTNLLSRVRDKKEVVDKENFNIAIAYLSSANTLPPRFKGPTSTEKKAITAVMHLLDKINIHDAKNSEDPNSEDPNDQARTDLKLLLQASLELKRLNHESIFSPARRWLNELPYVGLAFRPLTFLVALPFRFGGYILNFPGKLWDAGKTLRQDFGHNSNLTLANRITIAFSQFSSTLIGGRNKQTFKSALEEIIADTLGYSISGCKSALDRKGEVEVVKAAMLEHFSDDQSTLPDYYDVTNYNRFFVNHVMPMENNGHQIRLAATADYVGERKMWETRPGQYVIATDERQEMARLGAAFRDPKASKWEKSWDQDSNPFRAILRTLITPSTTSHEGSNQSSTNTQNSNSSQTLLFKSSSIQSVGVRTVTECTGSLTLKQFEESQSEFQNIETVSNRIQRVDILSSNKDAQTERHYIFKDQTPALTIIHNDKSVCMETTIDSTKEKEQIEMLALQIKMMTDKGMTASITQGPLMFREKLYQKCIKKCVSADKVNIPEKPSAPRPSSSNTL